MDVPGTLDRLRRDAASGELADLCHRVGVDLLVLFGSAGNVPERAQDVDVAYSFRRRAEPDDLAVVNALGEVYGDALDLMPLDRAGAVAAYAALGPGEVLVELTPEKFAIRQMSAWRYFVDTQKFRDLQLEVMAR